MTTMIRGGEYYNIAEAASVLGVSDRSIEVYISEGKLSAEKINRSVVILKEDLMAFKKDFKKWEKPR